MLAHLRQKHGISRSYNYLPISFWAGLPRVCFSSLLARIYICLLPFRNSLHLRQHVAHSRKESYKKASKDKRPNHCWIQYARRHNLLGVILTRSLTDCIPYLQLQPDHGGIFLRSRKAVDVASGIDRSQP